MAKVPNCEETVTYSEPYQQLNITLFNHKKIKYTPCDAAFCQNSLTTCYYYYYYYYSWRTFIKRSQKLTKLNLTIDAV